MSRGAIGARVALVLGCALVRVAVATVPAWAEAPTKICVPEKASTAVLSASAKNECPTKSTTKYKTEALPGPAELEMLDKLLPHIKYVEAGVGGKATIQFSGVNVQIVNGEGKTATTNGAGNLVIGYDELGEEHPLQTGSHDLILGEENTFTSYAAIDAGVLNSSLAPFASVVGGVRNTASGKYSTVAGGAGDSAVGEESSTSGGEENTAAGRAASVSGGSHGTAGGPASAVDGGFENFATGADSWVGGGDNDHADGVITSIFGGHGFVATAEFEACGGSPSRISGDC